MTVTGSCFVMKTSKTSGKDYRYYLDADICKEVSKAMGVEYKPKVKSAK